MERPGGLDTLAERWGGMTKAVATAGIAFFPRFVGHDYDNGHYTLVIVDNIEQRLLYLDPYQPKVCFYQTN